MILFDDKPINFENRWILTVREKWFSRHCVNPLTPKVTDLVLKSNIKRSVFVVWGLNLFGNKIYIESKGMPLKEYNFRDSFISSAQYKQQNWKLKIAAQKTGSVRSQQNSIFNYYFLNRTNQYKFKIQFWFQC